MDETITSGNWRTVRDLREFQSAYGIEGGILEDCDGHFDDAALSDDEAGLNWSGPEPRRWLYLPAGRWQDVEVTRT